MPTCISQYFSEIFFEWEMFQKSCRENQSKHFMFNDVFSENRAVYEIKLENIVDQDRA